MTRLLFVALGALLAVPSPAASHLLDEYLQATRIALARDRIVLEIDLTPGVAVAPAIVAQIDRDRDGQVSASEIEVYAQRVLRDLVFEVDDQRYALTLTRAECPSPGEMREGTGTIRLEVTAAVRLQTGGRHRIRYENAHQPAMGVYLVNALVPATRAITITGQRRDILQHGIHLDIDMAGPRGVAPWILLPGVGLTALVVYRLHPTTQRTRGGDPGRREAGCGSSGWPPSSSLPERQPGKRARRARI